MRLQSRKLVDAEQHVEHIAHDVVVLAQGGRGTRVIPAAVAFEDVPIEQETFTVAFKCNACHHEWTETVTKTERAK
ncbi:MAG: hypothetical protein JRN08_02520 [Nitrososphaerota archaeon]|nr:hypothetical protein [Nitrososphaerota archaeon]